MFICLASVTSLFSPFHATLHNNISLSMNETTIIEKVLENHRVKLYNSDNR